MRLKFVGIMFVSILITLSGCNAVQTSGGIAAESSGTPDSATAKGSNFLPASENTVDGQKWGYINEKAQFLIKPEYDGVEGFNNSGIAAAFLLTDSGYYSSDRNVYVLNTSGEKLYEQVKASGYFVTDDYIIIVAQGKSRFINSKGEVFFETDKEVAGYSDGMLRYNEQSSDVYKYGFMDQSGKVIIPAIYSFAEPFAAGRARVTAENGENTESFFIDKQGNKVVSQDQPVLFHDNSTNKYGYKGNDGKVIVEPAYKYANEFENGRAVVHVSGGEDEDDFLGLIDESGNYIIKPEYTGINYIGEGLYAVGKGTLVSFDRYAPKAIFDRQGKQLTDFVYYDVQSFNDGYASACDSTTTFFIDKSGAAVDGMPRVNGIGVLTLRDGIITADADNIRSYYDKNNKLIWMQDNTVLLADGIKARTAAYRPDYFTYIEYPQMEGLPDKSVEDEINKKLKTIFIGYKILPESQKDPEDGLWPNETTAGFSVVKNKELIIIEESGYFYSGGAHGMPSQNFYHINCRTGDFYELSSLFVKGSQYTGKLNSLVHKQVAAMQKAGEEFSNMFFDPESIKVREDQSFTIQDGYLRIYYGPYEIAPYAAGFPEFLIPYGRITDIVDTQGPFWKSFDKEVKENAPIYLGDVDADAAASITKLMLSYEKNLVEAINLNDFSKVEDSLLPGSSLYNEQKELVASLGKRNIKERFEKVDIYLMAHSYGKAEYKVFVYEDVAIKYPDKDFVIQSFNWCYTVNNENGVYKLSAIEKWQ